MDKIREMLIMKTDAYSLVVAWFDYEYINEVDQDIVKEYEKRGTELNAQIELLRFLLEESGTEDSNFNAKHAKQIADSLHKDELDTILENIKSRAEMGETVLHIYQNLKAKTIQVLTERGFRVVDQPSIAIQRDGLYYSIYWT